MRRNPTAARIVRSCVITASMLSLGACASLLSQEATSDTYQLTALPVVETSRVRPGLQLLVPEPTALKALDSENIVVRPDPITLQYLDESQWSDRLPRLVQKRLAETFEETDRFDGVGLPGQGLAIDYQIVTDIRAFGVDISRREATVMIAVKLLNDRNGTVTATETFAASAAFGAGAGAPDYVAALNRAFSAVVEDIVQWTSRRL